MKIDYESDNKGLNTLLNPISGYYDWSAAEAIEYLVFIDELDFEAVNDILNVESIRSINTDNTIKMEDIPPWVWNNVYRKWKDALVTGWSSDLWHGCDLCNWLNHNVDSCSSCPISVDNWCVNAKEGSRLHREWHPADDADNRNGDYQWRCVVRDFLDFVRPYCTVTD